MWNGDTSVGAAVQQQDVRRDPQAYEKSYGIGSGANAAQPPTPASIGLAEAQNYLEKDAHETACRLEALVERVCGPRDPKQQAAMPSVIGLKVPIVSAGCALVRARWAIEILETYLLG